MKNESLIEKAALEIADYANTCCQRSDGYEEDVAKLAKEKMLAILQQATPEPLTPEAEITCPCGRKYGLSTHGTAPAAPTWPSPDRFLNGRPAVPGKPLEMQTRDELLAYIRHMEAKPVGDDREDDLYLAGREIERLQGVIAELMEAKPVGDAIPSEAMCDRARGFIMGLDLNCRTWGGMKRHLGLGGYASIPRIDTQAEINPKGHITKWDVAECIYLLMTSPALTSQDGGANGE